MQVGQAGAQPATPEQIRFFETSIRPALAEHCYRCHGPAKQRADLRLDSQAHILRGSSAGGVIDKKHPEKSLLLKAIRHDDPELKMPPEKKLSDRQIADFTRWVKMGLPYPPERVVGKKESDKPHWAFQTPVDPALPAVKDAAWPRSPLDRFVLAKLEEKGLKPAPPADRRTLIRRVTFDLTGLPPTPDEVDAFLKDTSPDAFAKVVDRLLASPHYGERWGRHWLDIARYADSNGLDENIAFGNAWRYRDYVVAAFNADKPYDAFLLEQLAGDLLPTTDPVSRSQRLIATGFLALGPKVLAEVDEKKMEVDIVDEQIDTFGRAVLGMTFGCARCHDHKFDPITAKDYTGLAGIFQSTKTMEHFKKIAKWHENALDDPDFKAKKAAHDQKIAQAKEAVAVVVRNADAAIKAKGGTALPKVVEPLYPAETKVELKRLRDELAKLAKAGPEASSAMGVTEAKIVEAPIYIRGNHLKPGSLVARQVPEALAVTNKPAFDTSHSGRLELARWLVRPDHPLTARVMVNRIWRWHFSAGLVTTPDNFGVLGAAPTHPALLDWLAHRFIENKWSVKAMHRLIVLSNTYQQSSNVDATTVLADPENRFLARANVKRLEAEAIRDNLLAVTGMLDRTPGGSMLHVKNREFLFDHTSKDGTKYDSLRRSLYLPVIRNNVYDVFQLFDFPDPAVSTGDRATTTVATQALFLLNSDFVGRLCDNFAGELLKADGDDADRVQRLYAKAYGRPATEKEIARALDLVRGVEAALASDLSSERRRALAWACLCQTVVSANEFVYLE